MDKSSGLPHTLDSVVMPALVTPPRQGNRAKGRSFSRAAGEPYRPHSSRMTPSDDLTPPTNRRRCVSTGPPSKAQNVYPSPEPDTTLAGHDKKLPNSKNQAPKEVTSLVSEDELFEQSPKLKKQASIEVINLVSEDEISEKLPKLRKQAPKEVNNLVSEDELSEKLPKLKKQAPKVFDLLSEDELHEATTTPPRAPKPIISQSESAVTTIKELGISDTRPPRLNISSRTRSEPAKRPNTTPARIDKRLQDWVRKPLPIKQQNLKVVGNNYIFEAITKESAGKPLVKIGVTRGPDQVRLDGIARACRHLSIEPQDDTEHMPIRLYQRAEQLMHRELHDYRYSFKCRCKVKAHREYFDIDKGVALEVVQRWRDFCSREPYGANGILKPFWEQRLKNFKAYGDPGKEVNHERRAERWRTFMRPTQAEMLLHDLKEPFRRLWGCRWVAIALAQSFVIAVLAPSRITLSMFALMVSWAFVEISDLDQPVFFTALTGAADSRGRPELSRTSAAVFMNTAGKTDASGEEIESLVPDEPQEEEDEDSEDEDSFASSENESFCMEVGEDPDTTDMQNVLPVASEPTSPSIARQKTRVRTQGTLLTVDKRR